MATRHGRVAPSLSVGRVAGIRLTLDWSLLLVFGLLTWALATSVLPSLDDVAPATLRWCGAAVTAATFLGSLLVHELSHSLMARRHGIGVQDIHLWLLGGVSTLEAEPGSPRADFEIAIVGPAASAVLAVAFAASGALLALLGAPALVAGAAFYLAMVNGLLAVFNLLPGAPLDGGRVLRAFLWKRRDERFSAALSAARSGRTLGWALVAAGFVEVIALGAAGGVWLMLVGWFVSVAAQAEELQTIAAQGLQGARVRDVMTPNPVCAPIGITVRELLDGYVLRYRHSTFPLVAPNGRPAARDVLPREAGGAGPAGHDAGERGRLAAGAGDDRGPRRSNARRGTAHDA